MRKTLAEFCLVILAVTAVHVFRTMRSGYINGKIYPASKRNLLVAVNGVDSIKAISEQNGYFGMTLRPGTWKLIVGGSAETRSVVREGLEVNEGENINLGVIRLSE
jgi:hypothetical protein